jgi:hypothetical protein
MTEEETGPGIITGCINERKRKRIWENERRKYRFKRDRKKLRGIISWKNYRNGEGIWRVDKDMNSIKKRKKANERQHSPVNFNGPFKFVSHIFI